MNPGHGITILAVDIGAAPSPANPWYICRSAEAKLKIRPEVEDVTKPEDDVRSFLQTGKVSWTVVERGCWDRDEAPTITRCVSSDDVRDTLAHVLGVLP